MNNGKICVSICAGSAVEFLDEIKKAVQTADIIEIRFDCLEGEERTELLSNLAPINGKYVFTFRPKDQGGRRDLSQAERLKFWENVLSRKDLDFMIDIEAEQPLIEVVAPKKTTKIISVHLADSAVSNLAEIWRTTSARAPDAIVKIAVTTSDATAALAVWDLLRTAHDAGRESIPVAMGEAGKWTRILGPAYGAYMTYASPRIGGETASGQIPVGEMTDVYRVKELSKNSEVYGIIAGDTGYSISPYLHNAAFRSASIDSVFVPFQVDDLDAFIRRMVRPETREVGLNFRGFSVTNPHKQSIIRYLDHMEETAEKIGAVNTVKIAGGKLYGYNTDTVGFIGPLKSEFPDLKDASVAVVGAGGAARATAYALKNEGADVTILARNIEKARDLANEFEVGFQAFGTDLSEFDIVVNATPLGTRGKLQNETVATADCLRSVKLVYDLVYNPAETRLLHEARIAGAETLGGFDMLIAQAARQFEIWTGQNAPVKEMAATARKKLDEG